jgi:Fanconi anemia group M protein
MSSLIKADSLEIREYQQKIAESVKRKNSLVVLPTGMGKTLIAVLVAVDRLERFPDSKILITAPTRPLNAQHKKSFEKFTKLNPEEIILVTGKIPPIEREKLYKTARIIIATPQTIENDLENGRISLENFSFVTFDEAHRSVKEYSYTLIARKYKEQAKHPLILGLTASPGGTLEKIEEIKKNLFIESVEIRTETEEDVKKYVKEIVKDWLYIDLPEDFKLIRTLFEEVLKNDLYWLKDHHFTTTYKPNKTQLLMLQKRLAQRYHEGGRNFSLMWVMIRSAEAIKLLHAMELLETQGISPLYEYLKRLEASKKNTDKRLFKDPRMRDAFARVQELYKQGIEHPKLEALKNLVKEFLREKKNVKIIVFANYRSTVDKIDKVLKAEGIKSEILIGQTMKEGRGMTQEQQIETLKLFAAEEFNVLVGSSISEEGLDVPAVDYAIFYDAVPSEIRAIQRRGRVGRQTAGKIIFIITKDTRDEAYFHVALHKEKKMKSILYEMQENSKKKKILKDWIG